MTHIPSRKRKSISLRLVGGQITFLLFKEKRKECHLCFYHYTVLPKVGLVSGFSRIMSNHFVLGVQNVHSHRSKFCIVQINHWDCRFSRVYVLLVAIS